MSTVTINNIPQKLTLLDKQPGRYKLTVESEQAKEFYICVDTEKNFDDRAPTYKHVKNGTISVIVDSLNKDDIYEMMIMAAQKGERFKIIHQLERVGGSPSPGKKENEVSDEEKLHAIRKHLFDELAAYSESLSMQHRPTFDRFMKYIAVLYQTDEDGSRQAIADKQLEQIYRLTKAHPGNMHTFLASQAEMLDQLDRAGDGVPNQQMNNQVVRQQSDNVQPNNVSEETKETKGGILISGGVVLSVVIIALIIFFIMKYTNKKGGVTIPMGMFDV